LKQLSVPTKKRKEFLEDYETIPDRNIYTNSNFIRVKDLLNSKSGLEEL
jgi:hypothetical protein